MFLIHTLLIALTTALPVCGENPQSDGVPGVVEPSRQVTVQTTIDGRLESIDVSESQYVEAGQVLAQLDDDLAVAEVRLAKRAATQTGKLQFAEAELKRSQNILNRYERVQNHHAIAARELEEAYSNVAKAEGNLRIARDEIESLKMDAERAELRLDEYTLTAPFAGIVSKIRVSPGQVVQRQNVLMSLIDIRCLRVELAVPITAYRQLVVGEKYNLPVESKVRNVVQAELIAIDPVLDAGTNTVRCVFEIDNEDLQLPAGFLAYPPRFSDLDDVALKK